MRGKNTVLINGSQYDSVTGLPIAYNKPSAVTEVNRNPHARSIDGFAVSKPHPKVTRAVAAHQARKATKSATLRRDLVKKPEVKPAPAQIRPRAVVSKSPSISRFASHPMAMKPSESFSRVELPAKSSSTNHTINRVHQAVAKPAAPAKKPALSSRELKEKLIAEKLAEANTHSEVLKKQKSKKAGRSNPKLISVMSASLGVLLLAGYLTYINMPNLSMRVAASQAGVNAKFPDYHPSGYSFNGPIAYNNGEVAVKFQANGGNQNYVIKQKNSNWDSQAVLDNYVAKESSQYMTSSEQGLTIYTYKNKAAWVNGGVLYTIEGNAPLSNEQVLRIAGSM